MSAATRGAVYAGSCGICRSSSPLLDMKSSSASERKPDLNKAINEAAMALASAPSIGRRRLRQRFASTPRNNARLSGSNPRALLKKIVIHQRSLSPLDTSDRRILATEPSWRVLRQQYGGSGRAFVWFFTGHMRHSLRRCFQLLAFDAGFRLGIAEGAAIHRLGFAWRSQLRRVFGDLGPDDGVSAIEGSRAAGASRSG